MPCISEDLVTERVINKALTGNEISKNDLVRLLSINDDKKMELLFEASRIQRDRYFGEKVFLYGFVYFSTHCRNNCNFCHYRISNAEQSRYRRSTSEVIESAHMLADLGVHLIDLTMGEDPYYYEKSNIRFNEVISMIDRIKSDIGLPVMVSPGVVPDTVLAEMKHAGADWYACYQETHNQTLFKQLRVRQDYDRRLKKKSFAKKLGFLIEEGILTGVGETEIDIANSIMQMKQISAKQVRAMTFVPQHNTPLFNRKEINHRKELVSIAVMRLVMPDKLIPASLDVNGLSGLRNRLWAGANVVTSIIPPMKGLAGVANSQLDIEDYRRTPKAILPILESCGLSLAAEEEYVAWMDKRLSLQHSGVETIKKNDE